MTGAPAQAKASQVKGYVDQCSPDDKKDAGHLAQTINVHVFPFGAGMLASKARQLEENGRHPRNYKRPSHTTQPMLA